MTQNNVTSMGLKISVFWTLILISIWTIVQSIFHMTWIIYAYNTISCKLKPPSYYDLVFVYLTYFYKQDCGQIDLQNNGFIFNTTSLMANFKYNNLDIKYNDLNIHGESVNKTASEILYEFLKATLANASLPQESEGAKRLDIYLTIFFISDGLWILAGILLFIAAIFKLGKQWFLPCYGPWLFVTSFLIFLDVISSVHFGLDLIYIQNLSTWLKFIGVSNYKDFEYFNTYDSSKVLSSLPSTFMITLFSRCVIVWLINVMCFFAVLFRMLGLLYKAKSRETISIMRKRSKINSISGISNDLHLNTTEARIRNWQLFYGAIEASSTMASSSTSSPSDANSTDLNSNEKNVDKHEKNELQFTDGRYYNFENDQKSSSYDSLDLDKNGYRRFSDVALDMPNLISFQNGQEHMENCNNVNHYQTEVQVLRSQMPWSYISPAGNYLSTKQTLKKNHHSTNHGHAVIFEEKTVESTQL